MTRTLLLLLACLCVAGGAEAQQYRYPSPQEQEVACVKTGGRWEKLPDYCDNMHPRSWAKLTEQQQRACQNLFNEPCECGIGRRFSVVKVLGCVKSNFPQDLKRE